MSLFRDLLLHSYNTQNCNPLRTLQRSDANRLSNLVMLSFAYRLSVVSMRALSTVAADIECRRRRHLSLLAKLRT